MSIKVTPKKRSNEWDEYQFAMLIWAYEEIFIKKKHTGPVYSKLETCFRGMGMKYNRKSIDIRFATLRYSLTGEGNMIPMSSKRYNRVLKWYKDYINGKSTTFKELLQKAKEFCHGIPSREVQSLRVNDWITYTRGSKPYYCTFMNKDIFAIDRNTYPVKKNWASMYRALVREIYSKKSFTIPHYLDGHMLVVGKKDISKLKRPKDFQTGLFVETPCDPSEQLRLITLLLNEFGYSKKDIHAKCK